MKNTAIIALSFLINGACTSILPDQSSMSNAGPTLAATNPACSNMQTLVDLLHVQRLDIEGGLKDELLDSTGVNVSPDHSLRLVTAYRISGECSSHLDDINLSIFHFDTDITLMLNDEGMLVPYPRKYSPRNVVADNDTHPEKHPYRFVGAIEVGWGVFIGEWRKNERSILMPYRKTAAGEIHVGDNLFSIERKIISVRFLPHIDTPSGAIQILFQDGNDRVSLSFIWIYQNEGLFSR